MTDAIFTAVRPPLPRSRISAQNILWHSAIAILVLVPITLLAMAGEERLLNGINLWIKPLKFQVSVALHVVTLAILVRLIAAERQEGRWVRCAVWACAVSAMFEVAYITLQAGRGRHSHFNDSTVIEQVLYLSLIHI